MLRAVFIPPPLFPLIPLYSTLQSFLQLLLFPSLLFGYFALGICCWIDCARVVLFGSIDLFAPFFGNPSLFCMFPVTAIFILSSFVLLLPFLLFVACFFEVAQLVSMLKLIIKNDFSTKWLIIYDKKRRWSKLLVRCHPLRLNGTSLHYLLYQIQLHPSIKKHTSQRIMLV